MKVETLLRRLGDGKLAGDGGVRVKGITHDSRQVVAGNVFAAIPGEHVHGVKFVDQAAQAGAAAVLSDRQRPKRINLPWIKVGKPRPAMARAALILAGNPQKKLRLVAVTGTNGKSTTAHLISTVLNAAGLKTAFIGTLGAQLPDGTERDCERTTPEATDLAVLLREAVKAGAETVAMEVSSHALSQDRVSGLKFEVAVWTNLTRDHLDYHLDMESYFEAKARLFTDHLAAKGRRVLPVDDPWGARLLDDPLDGDVSWGLDRGAVCARMVASDLEGSQFTLRLPETEIGVRLPLVGVHNLRNGLAAAPAMDNRTGVWVVFEAARRAHAQGISCTLAVASTVQEEIGLRGTQTAAFGIDPHVGIAVDVTHATDCPTIDKRQRGTVELGKGPVIVRGPNINPRVGDRLTALSEAKNIPSQPAALGRAAPNDANPMQLTRAGVATGLVQIPNRYMHSAVETISLDDLDACADLLAAFAVALSGEDSFVP